MEEHELHCCSAESEYIEIDIEDGNTNNNISRRQSDEEHSADQFEFCMPTKPPCVEEDTSDHDFLDAQTVAMMASPADELFFGGHILPLRQKRISHLMNEDLRRFDNSHGSSDSPKLCKKWPWLKLLETLRGGAFSRRWPWGKSSGKGERVAEIRKRRNSKKKTWKLGFFFFFKSPSSSVRSSDSSSASYGGEIHSHNHGQQYSAENMPSLMTSSTSPLAVNPSSCSSSCHASPPSPACCRLASPWRTLGFASCPASIRSSPLHRSYGDCRNAAANNLAVLIINSNHQFLHHDHHRQSASIEGAIAYCKQSQQHST